jgi:hypothetical protein
MTTHRRDREIIVDVPRETVDDAATLTAASTAERRARFEALRPDFEDCAKDLIRSQAPEVRRVSIDTMTFHEWRERRKRITQGTGTVFGDAPC